jgi:hypothetical protein
MSDQFTRRGFVKTVGYTIAAATGLTACYVHGKDASIRWDVIHERGIGGSRPFVFHRTPGFGDCNWIDVISALREGESTGSVDIEGWPDPVYRGEVEMTDQVSALQIPETLPWRRVRSQSGVRGQLTAYRA